jgi:hypothetical protein
MIHSSARLKKLKPTQNEAPVYNGCGVRLRKTMKGSHNHANGLGPMHMVSAWLSEFGLTLAQVATDVKSNEITAIPEQFETDRP